MRRRGWNPDVFSPTRAGDGWLIRVKPPEQRLAAAAARRLASMATRWGSGAIEITTRASLQLRGVSEAAFADLAAALREAGLASDDPALEQRRNILVSPLAGDDPTIAGDPLALARALAQRLADPAYAALSQKFSAVIDGGGVLPLSGWRADIRITVREDGVGIAALDGTTLTCLAEEAPAAALTLAARMTLETRPPAPPPPPPPAGFLPYHGPDPGPCPGEARGAFALVPPFGAMRAPMLAALADLSEGFGDGWLRLAPGRVALIAGVAAARAGDLARAARAAGFITDPAAPSLGLIACIGAPDCAGGDAPSRADAAALAALLDDGVARPIHVSGCAKGCAHVGPAPVTLTGVGRDADGGGRYDLAFDASTEHVGLRAAHRLLSIAEAAALLNRGAARE